MSSKKWNDPQLDAAQFAIDRFLIAQQTVSEQMAEISQSTRDGCATDEDMKRLKILRVNYPTVPRGTERLRITATPYHDDVLIDQLAEALTDVWRRVALPLEGCVIDAAE